MLGHRSILYFLPFIRIYAKLSSLVASPRPKVKENDIKFISWDSQFVLKSGENDSLHAQHHHQ